MPKIKKNKIEPCTKIFIYRDLKFRAFPERVCPRILSLESVDYFGTSEHFRGRKKTKRRFLISTRLTGRVL